MIIKHLTFFLTLCASAVFATQSTNPLPPTDSTRHIFQQTFNPSGPEPIWEHESHEPSSSTEEELRVHTIKSDSSSSNIVSGTSSDDASSPHSTPTDAPLAGAVRVVMNPDSPLNPQLSESLNALLNTKWTLRDKIILGVNIALWGGTYYFLQKGIASSWNNDFFYECGDNDLACFIWQYVRSDTIKIRNNIMDFFVTPNVCIAWSFYVISRFMECSERYLPKPSVLTSVYKEQSIPFKLLSGTMDATAIVMGGILGGIPAVSYYSSQILGNWEQSKTLSYAVPLACFLMLETIITFKILKDTLIQNYLLKQGERGLKTALTEKLDNVKHAIFYQKRSDVLQAYKTFEEKPDGLTQLQFLLSLENPHPDIKKSKIRHYVKIAAGLLACGATAYIAYLNASDGLASLYDTVAEGFNFLGGIKLIEVRTLEYFNTYAPNPENATDEEALSWFNTCLDYALTNMQFNPECNLTVADIRNITEWDIGSSSSGSLPILCTAEGYFGENCAGVGTTITYFNIPEDIVRSVDSARSWLIFLLEDLQFRAGTTSTDPVPATDAALRFGHIMGGFSAAFTTCLTTLQTWRVVDGLFDLFSNHPKNAEAGRKSKIINGVNLAFSTFEAAFRTMPIAMINYFAMQDRVTNNFFWPLLIINGLVTMCTFINYFFDHYQKLPAAAQQFWWLCHYGKSKIWGTQFQEPDCFYTKYDALQKKADALVTHIAHMKDADLVTLSTTLGVDAPQDAEQETTIRATLQTARTIAENFA